MNKNILTGVLGVVAALVVGTSYFYATKAPSTTPSVATNTQTVSPTTPTAPQPEVPVTNTTTTTATTTPAVVTSTLTNALKQLPKKTPTSVAKPSITTVTYSGNDFLPRKVTVVMNSTVRFYNNSDHDMWVVSDIHPLHNLYPEKDPKNCGGSSFNECKAVPKGQYWDFTFHLDGTWGYHNESVPVDGGTIKVLNPKAPPPIPGY